MAKKPKIYGKFIIEFFEDGRNEQGKTVMGVKDCFYIDPKTPAEMQEGINIAIKALHKNYPYCIIAESDEIKNSKEEKKVSIQ